MSAVPYLRPVPSEHDVWRQRFSVEWRDVGRPFKKCVYCDTHHFVEKPYLPCTRERFVAGLVYTFPSLRRDCPGLTPWDAVKWARWWRTSGAQTSGSYSAVAFCLNVWSGGMREWERRGYKFDISRAMGVWDHSHRAAFLKWSQSPWWP